MGRNRGMGRKHKQNWYVIHQRPNKTEDKSNSRVSCRKEIASLRAAVLTLLANLSQEQVVSQLSIL